MEDLLAGVFLWIRIGLIVYLHLIIITFIGVCIILTITDEVGRTIRFESTV